MIDVVSFSVDKSVDLEVPHYDEFFVPGKTKYVEYIWSVDVRLCLEGSNIFVYDQKRNTQMDAQRVHITFGCALLTRSEILHDGFGGTIGCLSLRGTFHTGEYGYTENDVCGRNNAVNKNSWKKYCYKKGYLNAKKVS